MEKIDEKFLKKIRKQVKEGTVSLGASRAFWTYNDGKKDWNTHAGRKVSAYGFSGFCWEKDIHDFITTLRNIGVKKFVITNTSTALMDNLHGFADEGCYIGGLVTRQPETKWSPFEQGIVVCIREKTGKEIAEKPKE